jgi:hypothetical protein
VEEHQPTEIESARGWGKVMTMAYRMTKNSPIRKYIRKMRDKDRTS